MKLYEVDIEEVETNICKIFNKDNNSYMGWPRYLQRPVTIRKDEYYNHLEITICDPDDWSFATLEEVARVLNNKRINISTNNWEGGSDVTPCGGTDLTLTVLYDER